MVTSKKIKSIAYFLMLDMLVSICYPALHSAYALTSGPGSPEYSSFEPVATTNMVDPFSGNFTYNLPVLQIPGPDGGGYAMSLSHHSGASPEEESSWVGYGWTLNPGAINRAVRGIPDEYDGAPIQYYNKSKADWTVSGTTKANLEFFSNSGQGGADATPSEDAHILSVNISKYLRYNSNQGYAKTTSIGLSKAFGSLSMNRSSTGITFSATINPFAQKRTRTRDYTKQKNKVKKKFKISGNDQFSKENLKKSAKNLVTANGAKRMLVSNFGFQSFTDIGQSVTLDKVKGYNINVSFGLEINPAIAPIGFEGGKSGSFSLNYTRGRDDVPTYGYLNSRSDLGNYRQDYFTEKNQAFDKRDYFLGVPFSTPDAYMLTGEGLSGGFRAYRKSLGHYHPEKVEGNENRIRTFGLGVEFMIGTNIGIGVNLAFGNSKSEMKDWRKDGNTNDGEFKFDNTTDDYLYRFNGDMGGSVEYGSNSLTTARLNVSPNFKGIKGASINLPDSTSEELDDLDTDRATSSSFIEEEGDGFSIYNDAGLKYIYGQPVMVKNDASISTDVKGATIDKNYLAYNTNLNLKKVGDDYEVDVCEQEVVQGEIKTTPYAKSHLLTQITTSDYIDLGDAGADEADFGGWTKFEYYQKYGGTDRYRWRIPYNGLLYNKNSISNPKDDTGYLSTGEKDVFFLKQVETKTHIAYFVTNKTDLDRFGFTLGSPEAPYVQGSMTPRKDGLGAANLGSTSDPATAPGVDSSDEMEYLEKIVLFAKDRNDKPLQITNFAYDYHLMANLPNNVNGNYPDNTNSDESGKLTLRKIWSEFEGVVSARTSSYQFGYRYKDIADYTDDVKDDNPNLSQFFDLSNRYSVNAQNPNYNPHTLDSWGCNQFNGENRHLKMRNWPYQGDIAESAYDPAAWHLKQIKLPSGGEILVEYEEKDYSYVQDRNAMALVKLKSADDSYSSPSYELDLSDIGYDATDPEDFEKIDELAEYLRVHFLGENNLLSKDVESGLQKSDSRAYFKFLYALEGTNPSLTNCKSEYVTGYAKVAAVENVNHNIRLYLDTSSLAAHDVGIGLFENPVSDDGYTLAPRQGCYDYYVTQRWGKFEDGCQGIYDGVVGPVAQEFADTYACGGTVIENIGAIVGSFFFAVGASVTLSTEALVRNIPKKELVCLTINPELSYFKIPINKAKRGGGSRVKSLLMYDTGIEEGDAAIYGNTYNYTLENGQSSGVATNEPQEMREENALVSFLPKRDQSWLNRLIVGKDREQSEGPIGESLLPSASVGHSRVLVENIHKGKTGTGHTIHEFYTCKDYPFDMRYNYQYAQEDDVREFDFAAAKGQNAIDFSVLQDNSTDDRLRIPTPNFSYSIDNAWASQGFRFIVSDMNGKPKSIKTFGGKYIPGESTYISSGQEFKYYEPGERVRLLNENGEYEWDIPGKEMDVTMEKYRMYSQSLDFNFEIDVSLGLSLLPPIFVSGWLKFAFSEQNLSKHATSKVIRYPVIQKKVITYADNISSETENIGFDYGTGKPILTRTTDAYHSIPNESGEAHDGSIYALNLPAHWNYSEMGRKSVVPTYTNQLMASSGSVITYGSNANPINNSGTWNIKTDKVISASANTFNTLNGVSTWMDGNIHTVYGSSPSTPGLADIWRLHKSYTFKDNTKNSSNRITVGGKIYEGGTYNNYQPFDYALAEQPDDRWIKLNEVTKYSPNGNALEEVNAIGVYSAAKFGYDFTQPTMIAGNAEYNEIYFQDFEFTGDEDEIAHSGSASELIAPGETFPIVANVIAKTQIDVQGAWLKFWLKGEGDDPITIDYDGTNLATEKVAKTGEWSLYRVFMEESLFAFDDLVEITLTNNGTATIYADDVKFQPKEAQSTCYVYDVKSLRLITQFDDQHFGLYYQYNGEGKLVRQMIETERGLKTISETQYNVPRETR